MPNPEVVEEFNIPIVINALLYKFYISTCFCRPVDHNTDLLFLCRIGRRFSRLLEQDKTSQRNLYMPAKNAYPADKCPADKYDTIVLLPFTLNILGPSTWRGTRVI